jgi:two-component system CheB/CheR fusion protein
MWGLRQEEAIGEHLLAVDIGLPLERLQPTLKAVLAGQPAAEIELEAVNRRGRPVRVRVKATPLASGKDGPEGSVLVMRTVDGAVPAQPPPLPPLDVPHLPPPSADGAHPGRTAAS